MSVTDKTFDNLTPVSSTIHAGNNLFSKSSFRTTRDNSTTSNTETHNPGSHNYLNNKTIQSVCIYKLLIPAQRE
jgi:hypothetical protein